MSMTTRSSRRLSFDLEGGELSSQAVVPRVCALCKKKHKHMSQVHTWQSAKACGVAAKFGITPADTVCRPCRDDVRRVIANPRWEKIHQSVTTCCVEGCASICFAHSKVTDTNTLKDIFEQANVHNKGDTIPFPTPLCNHHYYMVYNAVQPQQTNCPTCGISLRYVTSRPCPNAQVISEHTQATVKCSNSSRVWHLQAIQ